MNRLILLPIAIALVSTARAADVPRKADQPALAGGYSSSEIDSEVRKVAGFAVRAQSEATGKPFRLVKVLKAERQVVAGLNYRLEVEVDDGSKRLTARAVVWKKLDGSLALTAWDAR